MKGRGRPDVDDVTAQLAGAARVVHRVLGEIAAGRIEADVRQVGYLRGAVDALRLGVSIHPHRDGSGNGTAVGRSRR